MEKKQYKRNKRHRLISSQCPFCKFLSPRQPPFSLSSPYTPAKQTRGVYSPPCSISCQGACHYSLHTALIHEREGSFPYNTPISSPQHPYLHITSPTQSGACFFQAPQSLPSLRQTLRPPRRTAGTRYVQTRRHTRPCVPYDPPLCDQQRGSHNHVYRDTSSLGAYMSACGPRAHVRGARGLV